MEIDYGTNNLKNVEQVENQISTTEQISSNINNAVEIPAVRKITVGNVTTEQVESDQPADVDISTRTVEKTEYMDFNFEIPKGETGPYFTPAVDDEGNLSWTNNGDLTNPETVNIRGPQGLQGPQGPPGDAGTFDDALSETSTNGIQNKVVTAALNEKLSNNGEQILEGTLKLTNASNPFVTVDETKTIIDNMNNTSRTTTNASYITTDGLIVGEIKETTTSSGSNTVVKQIQYGLSDIKLNDSPIVDIDDNGTFNFFGDIYCQNEKIARFSKEYKFDVSVGTTDKVICIGKFPIYDSNITIDVSTTTNVAYSGKIVFACQNHVVNQALVYDDPYRNISSRVYYKVTNNVLEIYMTVGDYGKTLAHISCRALNGEPTNIGDVLSAIPSDATTRPTNVFDLTSRFDIGGPFQISGTTTNLNSISHGTNSTIILSYTDAAENKPTNDSGFVIQYQESYSYCTQLAIANDAEASTWRRSYRDGTWTAWEKLSKLKSATFTSITDFYNFMQDNIDSVSEVIITPSANITGNQTNLNITSSASTFTNSSTATVLYENYEYRFNQFAKTSGNVHLEGKGFTSIVGENHIAAIVTSVGLFRFNWNTAVLTAANYAIIQAYAQGQYTNLTFKVYYFD